MASLDSHLDDLGKLIDFPLSEIINDVKLFVDRHHVLMTNLQFHVNGYSKRISDVLRFSNLFESASVRKHGLRIKSEFNLFEDPEFLDALNMSPFSYIDFFAKNKDSLKDAFNVLTEYRTNVTEILEYSKKFEGYVGFNNFTDFFKDLYAGAGLIRKHVFSSFCAVEILANPIENMSSFYDACDALKAIYSFKLPRSESLKRINSFNKFGISEDLFDIYACFPLELKYPKFYVLNKK